jgi:hypothetical protein
MKDFKFVYLWNSILRAIAFVCITIAAIHFNAISILWFYLLPAFMEIEYKNTDKDNDNNE